MSAHDGESDSVRRAIADELWLVETSGPSRRENCACELEIQAPSSRGMRQTRVGTAEGKTSIEEAEGWREKGAPRRGMSVAGLVAGWSWWRGNW